MSLAGEKRLLCNNIQFMFCIARETILPTVQDALVTIVYILVDGLDMNYLHSIISP